MGQTLTHGVYLPDEGERNCYSGLAANWQILDGAVGTIAAHTAALSGKAPLVHTHTKSDITDFPAYGTTAGTICEGNDSRLSDARTPVAHTHTKSDVTDLLNSDFIPSANNTYDLGSSSYQWNNAYAKSYYYNGTEFQSKFATLDTVQTFSVRKDLKNYWHLMAVNLTAGAGETYSRTGYSFIYTDKNDITMGDVTLYKQSRAARTYLRLQAGDYYTNGVPDASGTLVQSELRIGTLANSTRMIECATDAVYSTTDAATDLGTSDKRWKSFNGLNPGVLSFPKLQSASQELDISAQGLNWDLTGQTENSYTPLLDGWLQLRCEDVDGDYLFACWQNFRQSIFGRGLLSRISYGLAMTIPVRKNVAVTIICKATSNMSAIFTPCLGNV